jgi:hypothetical protein
MADIPGGWIYLVPETQVEIKGISLYTLVQEVGYHYKINRLDEPDDLQLLIEAQICEHIPEAFCKEVT